MNYGRLLLWKWERMAEGSVISFLTNLAPFLTKLKVACRWALQLSLQLYQVCLRSKYNGSLPAWLDGVWCWWRLVLSSVSSPGSPSVSIELRGEKNFQVGTSGFNCYWGSLTPGVGVIGFLALLWASSVGFRFRSLCSRNSSLDGNAVFVVLVVSFWQRSLGACRQIV